MTTVAIPVSLGHSWVGLRPASARCPDNRKALLPGGAKRLYDYAFLTGHRGWVERVFVRWLPGTHRACAADPHLNPFQDDQGACSGGKGLQCHEPHFKAQSFSKIEQRANLLRHAARLAVDPLSTSSDWTIAPCGANARARRAATFAEPEQTRPSALTLEYPQETDPC